MKEGVTVPRHRTKPVYLPGSQADQLHASFDVFLLDRQATGCAPLTLRFYSTALLPFIQWLLDQGVTGPEQVTVTLIQHYTVGRPDWKPSTRKVTHVAIRAWLRLLAEREIIAKVPQWKLPRVPAGSIRREFLTGEDVSRVLASCRHIRDRVLVALLVDSGMRRCEASPLKWGDVDMTTGAVCIRKGKGGKTRTAFVSGVALGLLRELQGAIAHRPGDNVLTDRSGSPLTVPALSRRLDRLGKRAGVRLSAHRLRRSYATLSTVNGMGLAALSATMGHASIEQTRDYVKLVTDDLLVAHAAASPMDHLEAK